MELGRVKWDLRFLRLAREVSTWSKDPSTQVGAVLVDKDRRVVSLGYNGFPRRINDIPERLMDRATKLRFTIHAEINALHFAEKTTGCVLYTWPLPMCSGCTAQAVQLGISRAVSIEPSEDHLERWGVEFQDGLTMLHEADVVFTQYAPELLDAEDESFLDP